MADATAVLAWGRAQLRSYLMRDFYTFAKHSGMCPDIEEVPYREVCDYLESRLPNTPRIAQWRKETNRKAVTSIWKFALALFLMPRLTFKTSLIAALCVYAILLDPDIRISLGRATTTDAEFTLSGIKSHLEFNEVLQRAFGDVRSRFTKWTDAVILLGERKPGLREATIDTTGLNTSKTGFHPDLVILDDLVHENNYQSAAQMASARTKVQAFYPILERWGSMIVMGTRWGDNDVYGWILDQESVREEKARWNKLVWSCWLDEEGTVPRFPTVLPVERIEDLREQLDSKLFAAFLLNDARAEGEKIFTLSYIQYFDADFVGGPFPRILLEDTDLNRPLIARFGRSIPVAVAGMIDPAPTVGKSSDFTGVVFVAFDAQANWWVLSGIEVKQLPTDRLMLILSLARRYTPHTLALENADLDAPLLQERLSDAGIQTRVVSFNPRQDRLRITADPNLSPKGRTKKAAQIEAMEPTLRARRVFFARGETTALVRQLLHYPYLDHDDVVDAFSMGKAYEQTVTQAVDDNPERIFEEIERHEFEMEGIAFDTVATGGVSSVGLEGSRLPTARSA